MPDSQERAGTYIPEQEADFCIWIIGFCLTEYENKTKKAQGTNGSCREQRSLVLKHTAESELWYQSGNRCRKINGEIKSAQY